MFFQTHVLEKTGLVQRAHDFRRLVEIDGVARLDRQVVEDGTRGDALQALHADIRNAESFCKDLCSGAKQQ